MFGMRMGMGLGMGASAKTPDVKLEQIATPVLSITGVFPKWRLTISCATPGVTIYWNLNAPSDPDESSSLYAGQTTIILGGQFGQENTFKARAYKEGMSPSEVGIRIVLG